MASTGGTRCDHCGSPAEGPGTITVQILDDQGDAQLGLVKLCPACAREFGLWLPLADLPATDADDDLVDELEGD
jgi:hypothetical protein